MEEEKESSSSSGNNRRSDKKGGRKLERQRSRLQMQAPSSIQVTPTSMSSISDWNIAIPLLSPLDIHNPLGHPSFTPPPSSSFVDHQELRQREEVKDDGEAKGNTSGAGWRAWQHPAAPFHYEPVPGNGPAFILHSHCA